MMHGVEKYAPSGWWAGTEEDGHLVYANENQQAVVVADTMREDGDAQAEGDAARFIAAAPDLLAALRRFACIEVNVSKWDPDSAIELKIPHGRSAWGVVTLRLSDIIAARAAITKAEGTT